MHLFEMEVKPVFHLMGEDVLRLTLTYVEQLTKAYNSYFFSWHSVGDPVFLEVERSVWGKKNTTDAPSAFPQTNKTKEKTHHQNKQTK